MFRNLVPLAIALGLIAASLVMIAKRLDITNVYLTSDAAHYLADADALVGRGVREIRHPPLFPLFVELIRTVVPGNLLATKAVILAVVAVLGVCFYFFVRGRTGSPVGDVAATGLFVLAPTTAEAIGWFAGASLLGIALSLISLRLLADVVEDPRVSRSIAAAVAVAAVVLTHPFTVVFLAETTAAYLAFRLIVSMIRSRSFAIPTRSLVRVGGMLSIIAAGAVLALVVARDFYGFIQNPLTFTPAVQQLNQLWTWAFRDDPALWLSLLGASSLVIPVAYWTAGERGLDLGLAVTALNAVMLFNVAFLEGNLSYVTRSLYFAPIPIAATFGVGVAAIGAAILSSRARRNADRGRRRRKRPRLVAVSITAAAWLGVVALIGAPALESFAHRLDVAVSYYNRVDQQELVAIDYLTGRKGTVIVTPKGSDMDAGTQYSWMIEGLAHVRALGSGTSFVSLSAIADRETADAERFAAGPEVVENGQLRAAFDGTTRSRVKIYGNVDRTWYPLFDVEPHVPLSKLQAAMVTSDSQLGGGELSSRDGPQDAAATITLDGVDRPLRISFPASQLGAGGQLDVNLDGSQRGLAVTPSGFSWNTSLDGKAVTVRIGTSDGATVPDPTPATKSVVAFRTTGPSGPLSLDITTSGLTGTLTSSQVFTQAQLIHDQGIRYLWTWRSTDMLAELAARPCMQLVFENDDVAIFSVDGNCRG